MKSSDHMLHKQGPMKELIDQHTYQVQTSQAIINNEQIYYDDMHYMYHFSGNESTYEKIFWYFFVFILPPTNWLFSLQNELT